MTIFVRLRYLLLALSLAAMGCQPAQMRVHPSLDAASPLAVRGANPRVWNSPISFGSWSTTVVHEGLVWGFGYRLLGIEARYAQQPYQIALRSPAGITQAECLTRAVTLARDDLQFDPALGKLPALSCGFTGVGGEGTMRLHTTASNAQDGEIRFAGETWVVRSSMRFSNSPLPSAMPLGYEIARGEDVIAAVETINSGRVWIAANLAPNEKERAALIAAVLLLYVPAEA